MVSEMGGHRYLNRYSPEWREFRYFRPEEFACPCCGRVYVLERLVRLLDLVREAWGAPIRVESGYRCPDHNRRIGGAPNSAHVIGAAADIWPKLQGPLGHCRARFLSLLQLRGFRRFGLWHDFGFHVDLGDLVDPHTYIAPSIWIY